MRKFRLLKDLPGIEKGEISDNLTSDNKAVGFTNNHGYIFYIQLSQTEWIEEIKEIAVSELSFEEQVNVLYGSFPESFLANDCTYVLNNLHKKGYQIVKKL